MLLGLLLLRASWLCIVLFGGSASSQHTKTGYSKVGDTSNYDTEGTTDQSFLPFDGERRYGAAISPYGAVNRPYSAGSAPRPMPAKPMPGLNNAKMVNWRLDEKDRPITFPLVPKKPALPPSTAGSYPSGPTYPAPSGAYPAAGSFPSAAAYPSPPATYPFGPSRPYRGVGALTPVSYSSGTGSYPSATGFGSNPALGPSSAYSDPAPAPSSAYPKPAPGPSSAYPAPGSYPYGPSYPSATGFGSYPSATGSNPAPAPSSAYSDPAPSSAYPKPAPGPSSAYPAPGSYPYGPSYPSSPSSYAYPSPPGSSVELPSSTGSVVAKETDYEPIPFPTDTDWGYAYPSGGGSSVAQVQLPSSTGGSVAQGTTDYVPWPDAALSGIKPSVAAAFGHPGGYSASPPSLRPSSEAIPNYLGASSGYYGPDSTVPASPKPHGSSWGARDPIRQMGSTLVAQVSSDSGTLNTIPGVSGNLYSTQTEAAISPSANAPPYSMASFFEPYDDTDIAVPDATLTEEVPQPASRHGYDEIIFPGPYPFSTDTSIAEPDTTLTEEVPQPASHHGYDEIIFPDLWPISSDVEVPQTVTEFAPPGPTHILQSRSGYKNGRLSYSQTSYSRLPVLSETPSHAESQPKEPAALEPVHRRKRPGSPRPKRPEYTGNLAKPSRPGPFPREPYSSTVDSLPRPEFSSMVDSLVDSLPRPANDPPGPVRPPSREEYTGTVARPPRPAIDSFDPPGPVRPPSREEYIGTMFSPPRPAIYPFDPPRPDRPPPREEYTGTMFSPPKPEPDIPAPASLPTRHVAFRPMAVPVAFTPRPAYPPRRPGIHHGTKS